MSGPLQDSKSRADPVDFHNFKSIPDSTNLFEDEPFLGVDNDECDV